MELALYEGDLNRLRRLEEAAVTDKRAHAAAEAILEARRRRLGADYVEPIPFSPESYAGCRTSADRIRRTRELLMDRQATKATHRGQETGAGNRCR
jgi:hypothetical protein